MGLQLPSFSKARQLGGTRFPTEACSLLQERLFLMGRSYILFHQRDETSIRRMAGCPLRSFNIHRFLPLPLAAPAFPFAPAFPLGAGFLVPAFGLGITLKKLWRIEAAGCSVGDVFISFDKGQRQGSRSIFPPSKAGWSACLEVPTADSEI